MGRNKKKRFVENVPTAVFFKPQGVPLRELKQQAVSIEEFEALRLVDSEGLQQQAAADQMGISRPTLSRVLAEARKAVATALSNGWAIRIEGGDYHDLSSVCRLSRTDSQTAATNGGDIMPGKGSGQCARGQGRGQGHGQGQGQGQGICQRSTVGQRSRGKGPATGQTSCQEAKGHTVTKVAVTSEGPNMDDAVDPRFGRAAGFVIVDLETMASEYVDNGSSQVMSQGAGIQAAETVANAGAEVLLTGYVGPKAFTALTAAGIRIGQDVDGMTVREACAKFERGEIELADAPNAQSGGRK